MSANDNVSPLEACCAHLTVKYTTSESNGLTTGWWECKDCKHRFSPIAAEAACSQSVAPGGEGIWVIMYAPTEHEPEVFIDAGAEEAARKRYAIAKLNWTCHLLCEAAPPAVFTPRPTAEELNASFDLLFGKYRVLLKSNADELVLLDYEDEIRRRAGAVSTPRCPKCGEQHLWFVGITVRVRCNNPECMGIFGPFGNVKDLCAQFFQPAQPLPSGGSK